MTRDNNDDETELQLVYDDLERLRHKHADLLAAAKAAIDEIAPIPFTEERHAIWLSLKAAIARTEEA